MVFGCISKNFPENIFWCLEKKKENTNQKMQNNTNQKNTSHKSRKTQIQNNTSKLRLVHSNIFTENASNQAKETKTQQKKCNQFFNRADERCASDERARRSRGAISSIAPWDWRSRREIDDRAARSRRSHSEIDDRAASIAPLVGAVRSSAQRRDLGSLFSLSLSLWSGLSLLSLSLSLSLFFRKWFEVKMRGENDFRVKGENIGQPEVIFRKMIFSVTAKHSGFMENDFQKQFSPNSNTPLDTP